MNDRDEALVLEGKVKGISRQRDRTVGSVSGEALHRLETAPRLYPGLDSLTAVFSQQALTSL